jgi:hypothetical protein
MALAVAQVGGAFTNGASTAVTFGSTTTAGSLIVANGNTFNTTTFAAGDVTDNKSNSYVKDKENNGGASNVGSGVWSNNGGTRGASHQVTFAPASGSPTSLAICEVTGQAASNAFDTTTAGTATDNTSPFAVTAGGAISGNQIAFYVCCVNSSTSAAWSGPSGYTGVFADGNGATDLTSNTAYKIDETGTPTVSSTNGFTVSGNAVEVFVTYKEAAAGGGFDVPLLRFDPQYQVHRM